MLVINEYEELNASDCEIENLFILLGSLVVKNYSQIILNYDNELSSEIKSILTLLINNLLLCTQLQSRIFNLKEEITSLNREDGIIYLDETMKQIKYDEARLKKSLTLKEERLVDLNKENIELLIKLGNKFYQGRWLDDKREFKKVYNEINSLLYYDGQTENLDYILNDKSDTKLGMIYKLLKPYPTLLY